MIDDKEGRKEERKLCFQQTRVIKDTSAASNNMSPCLHSSSFLLCARSQGEEISGGKDSKETDGLCVTIPLICRYWILGVAAL